MNLFLYDQGLYVLQSTFTLKHTLTFTIVKTALQVIRKPRGLTG